LFSPVLHDGETLLLKFNLIFILKHLDILKRIWIFTREYTQCTAGYTFCFVVVGGVGVGVATFNQTWQYFS
jgi:hypothetical protein